MNIADEKSRATFRRLLLSKQLYLHGLDHSNKGGALNKMIAVHNFHNAIEITLRAIFLYYEIRKERELNIEFEVMLNEIDNHKEFKNKNIKLPYRQDLRNLNQLRNHVQHNAFEPESAAMEDWRVFTHRFLDRSFKAYFDQEFGSVSAIDMIEDEDLRKLLKLSLSNIKEEKLVESLVLAKFAFLLAIKTISSSLPSISKSNFFSEYSVTSSFDDLGYNMEDSCLSGSDTGNLKNAFRNVLDIIKNNSQEIEQCIVLLSSGTNLIEYNRFYRLTACFIIHFTGGDTPIIYGNDEALEFEEKTTKWVNDFVVDTIVHWQVLGLKPGVAVICREGVKDLIEGRKKLFT